MAHYLDTSALVKLLVADSETDALRRWISTTASIWVSSDLARTELLRTARRAAPDLVRRAREVLDALAVLEVTTRLFEDAGRLDPPTLRTLDAIHLAAALDLGDELEGMVTYDERLADAATANGIAVIAPA